MLNQSPQAWSTEAEEGASSPTTRRILVLGSAHDETRDALENVFRANNVGALKDDDGFLWVNVDQSTPQDLLSTLATSLSIRDLEGVRASFITDRRTLCPKSILQMQPLLHIIQKAESEWLVDLIREERMLTAFQPIFDLRGSGDVFAHECLMRGVMTDGSIVSPGKMIPLARKSKLMYHLDQLARSTAFRNAVRVGIESNLFINFNPNTVLLPESATHLLDDVLEVGLDPERVVFEVTEAEEVEDVPQLLRVMEYYREAGFKIALDDLGSGYNGLNILSQLRPDFVKFDAGLIREVDLDPFKQTIASHLLAISRKLNIKTVMEGIETKGELEWVMAQGADFGQGFYLGYPDFAKYPSHPCPAIQEAA